MIGLIYVAEGIRSEQPVPGTWGHVSITEKLATPRDIQAINLKSMPRSQAPSGCPSPSFTPRPKALNCHTLLQIPSHKRKHLRQQPVNFKVTCNALKPLTLFIKGGWKLSKGLLLNGGDPSMLVINKSLMFAVLFISLVVFVEGFWVQKLTHSAHLAFKYG